MSPPPPRANGPSRKQPPSPRRRRRGRRRNHHKKRIVPLFISIPVVVGLVLAAAGFGGAAAFRASCSLKDIRVVKIGQNSFVYAADGSLLGSIPAERNRESVRMGQISPWMGKATVAGEDRRFYQHGGLDYEGIFRAAWRDVRAGALVEGGSTITQQLVRNLYIGHPKRTLGRKIKEACLAMKVDEAWSKHRILQSYLNRVYYGNHSYGIEAAAQTYFSRRAKSLTLPQAALLAGLPQAPSIYDPYQRPREALRRRNAVLKAMVDNGDITRRQFRSARRARLRLKPGGLYTQIREPYFFSYVRDQLIEKYGADRVRFGGLRVYTTVIPRYQHDAVRAIRNTLYYHDDPAAAVVAIDPASGAIQAMTGVTPGRKGNQFNLVAQARRQAGSTFKTFVLTTAVSQGIDPATSTFISAPFHYQPNSYSQPWDVSTYSHSYSGEISIQQATLQSDNTVYAQLTLDVGPENVAAMAHR